MPKIEIYTSITCPYCTHAKSLLARKGATFTEIDVTSDTAKRTEMIQRAGGRMTVPQIFIGYQHIGGFDDLARWDREGRLDVLLKSS